MRGLKRAAEHALLFSDESTQILANHLPTTLITQAPEAQVPVSETPSAEPAQLEALLVETKGNVAEIARRMGVHRQQVYRWISKANLVPTDYRDA